MILIAFLKNVSEMSIEKGKQIEYIFIGLINLFSIIDIEEDINYEEFLSYQNTSVKYHDFVKVR